MKRPTDIMEEKKERLSRNSARMKELMEVLSRHELVKGITPEKLCTILTDLGPTFIKLGQILSMRSDILPVAYCEALASLRNNVPPMPFEEVSAIIEDSFGQPLDGLFASFDEKALGSASIGQAHRAELPGGEKVIVKVRRNGIDERMKNDIELLRRAAALLKYTPVSGLVDFNQVLDEMWKVTREEIDFLAEAEHLEKFHALNEDVAFATCPKLYRAQTTSRVLTMECIDGIQIDKKEALLARGYDLKEIGTKLADNYIKQILDDGYFHADPHPGNIMIRGGEIVWIDMGMMGVLGDREKKLIAQCILAMANGDFRKCTDVLLKLGEFKGEVDKKAVNRDVERMVSEYADSELGSLDLSTIMNDVVETMKKYNASMPGGLSMLVRGIATVEGVVEALNPDIRIVKIAAARIGGMLIRDYDWQNALRHDVSAMAESAKKALHIPALVNDLLEGVVNGDNSIGMELNMSSSMSSKIEELVLKACAAILGAALLLLSGLFRSAGPAVGGVPVISAAAILLALVLAGYVFFYHKKP